MSVCGIAVGTSLQQLGFEAQHFFLVSSSFGGAQVGLRRSQLSLGSSGLGTRVGVIQNDQQLPLLDRFAFLDKNALYTRRDRSVGFEVISWLNFSVRGNQAADFALLNDGGAHQHGVVAAGDEGSQHDDPRQNHKRGYPPAPPSASPTVSIQWHAEKTPNFNVSPTCCSEPQKPPSYLAD